MKDESEIYEWNDGKKLVGTEKTMKKGTERDRRRGKVHTYEKEITEQMKKRRKK